MLACPPPGRDAASRRAFPRYAHRSRGQQACAASLTTRCSVYPRIQPRTSRRGVTPAAVLSWRRTYSSSRNGPDMPRTGAKTARATKPRKAASKKPNAVTATAEANPLLADWIGPYEIPPFGLIEHKHFKPAYEVAFAEHNAEIAAIAKARSRPTFANTIEA